MTIVEALVLAVGLSMDSFSVSVACGGVMKNFKWGESLKIALILALFQGGLTLIGWVLGIHFSRLIESVDHWVAFALLMYLGGKMIYESLFRKDEETVRSLSLKTIATLGLATSIDALAIGISMAFLKYSIIMPVIIITIVTLLFSVAGLILGTKANKIKYLNVGLIGGLILVGLGIKVLIEHTLL